MVAGSRRDQSETEPTTADAQRDLFSARQSLADPRCNRDALAMHDAIERGEAGILTYGLTPPKRTVSEERRHQVAQRQSDRIAALPIDGLVIYDLQDESTRTAEERPYPFVESIDPVEYAWGDLASVPLPKIVYRCVAPLSSEQLTASLQRIEDERGLTVFVGAASSRQAPSLSLERAYALRRTDFPKVPLGGVLIAERHEIRKGEDLRVLRKLELGCSYFVTQAVYSAVATKNVLSDLYYRCDGEGRKMPPILVTLSPCGSERTLKFMRWLGIAIPRWLENELFHATDILETSMRLCTDILVDLVDFARRKRIPLGCNVESVSLNKAEIDASVELCHRAKAILTA